MELDETQQILISFSNGEKLAITLTDKVTLDSLYEYIYKKSSEEEVLNLESEQDGLLNSRPEPVMSNTKANAILTEIRANWNSKKRLKEGMIIKDCKIK